MPVTGPISRTFHSFPAAAIVTRVISRPAADRVTLDIGNKAVAADPPRGSRMFIPELPTAVQEIHSEEHMGLVLPMLIVFSQAM
jgi:D-serine deaminase-like pyridoxal phosphate-dependent protein